jgi:hypothetical protein
MPYPLDRKPTYNPKRTFPPTSVYSEGHPDRQIRRSPGKSSLANDYSMALELLQAICQELAIFIRRGLERVPYSRIYQQQTSFGYCIFFVQNVTMWSYIPEIVVACTLFISLP